MQYWKIRRMSVKRINLWLSCIGKLLKHYEGEVRLYDCPLCKVNRRVGCEICPWGIIEGVDCEQAAQELCSKSAYHCRNHYILHRKWRTLRLRQLRNWKIIFKIELARRDV